MNLNVGTRIAMSRKSDGKESEIQPLKQHGGFSNGTAMLWMSQKSHIYKDNFSNYQEQTVSLTEPHNYLHSSTRLPRLAAVLQTIRLRSR